MIKKAISSLVPIISPAIPVSVKEHFELKYWKKKKSVEGEFSNEHYQHFYTQHFDISSEFYENKVLLDIGCGPRGSLEWAKSARRKIGLDPLAEKYNLLSGNNHEMEYLSSPSEDIPLDDNACDAVFSFNSLDHVEDVQKSIDEIKRITKPGGIFLLLVEVNHPPTLCEPHLLTPASLTEMFAPDFTVEKADIFRITTHGMYQSLLEPTLLSSSLDCTEKGYFSCKFYRN